MKMTVALCALVLVVSCGKGSGGSNGSAGIQREEVERNPAMNPMPDLLNVSVDVPVEMSAGQLRFLRAASVVDRGSRLACEFSVRAGEVWSYKREPYRLVLEQPNGRKLLLHEYSRGVWITKVQQSGMRTTYRVSLLNNKFVLNLDCEG